MLGTCKNVQNTNVALGGFVSFCFFSIFFHRNENQRCFRCRRCRCRFSVQFELPSNFHSFFFAPHFNLKNISTGAKPILIRQFLIIILSIYQLWIVYYPFQIKREFNTKIFKRKKNIYCTMTRSTTRHTKLLTLDLYNAKVNGRSYKVWIHTKITTLFQRISWSIFVMNQDFNWRNFTCFFSVMVLWLLAFVKALNRLNGKFVVLGNLSNFVIIIMIVKFYIFPFRIVIFLIKQINIKFLIIIIELKQLLMSM